MWGGGGCTVCVCVCGGGGYGVCVCVCGGGGGYHAAGRPATARHTYHFYLVRPILNSTGIL